jgi:hypothetical protein
MATIKEKTMIEKIEEESENYLADENVKEKQKSKFKELGETTEALYKKYQMISSWKNKLKKTDTDVVSDDVDSDINTVKEIFRNIKNRVKPSNKKLFNIIFKQTTDLLEYLDSSQERELLEEEKRLEREIEEKKKELEKLKEKRNSN